MYRFTQNHLMLYTNRMNKQLLSIIVPVYNKSTSIKMTLDSIVLATDGKTEIICVNDGSLDNSLDILNDYFKVHKSVPHIIINQKNKGLTLARYSGILAASGEYIMHVDCGDCLDSKEFKKVLFTLDNTQNKYDGYLFDYVYIKDDKRRKITADISDGINLKSLLACRIPYAIWCKIFKKSLYTDLDLYSYKKRIDNGEDLCASFEIMAKTNNILYINQYPYIYYYEENSLSHTDNETITFLTAIDFLIQYTRQHKSTCKKNISQLIMDRVFKILYYSKIDEYYEALLRYARKRYLYMIVNNPMSFIELFKRIVLIEMNVFKGTTNTK